MKKSVKQAEKRQRAWGLATRLKHRVISGKHNVRKLRKQR